jgi:hypothetical protein
MYYGESTALIDPLVAIASLSLNDSLAPIAQPELQLPYSLIA